MTAPARFTIDEAGRLWTGKAALAYDFWRRYLDVFEEVRVCARARRGDQMAGAVEATGPGVVAAPLPYFIGPIQFALCSVAVGRRLTREVDSAEAVILRLPCQLGYMAWRRLPPGKPFGVEMVGDPFDVFGPGSVHHPLRPVFRWWSPRKTRRACAAAPAIAYVTKCALQRRYPPGPTAYSTWYSSVVLTEDQIAAAPRQQRPWPGPFVIVFVGTLAQLYKAPDVLLRAVAICLSAGADVTLRIVGDGRHRRELEALAEQLGIAARTVFVGELATRAAVVAELDRADLFVLPSHQEGLPRALIEAMARGLPCLGSTVGGIPELLDGEDVIEPGNVEELAALMLKVLRDRTRREAMALRNQSRARLYQLTALRPRRAEFYRRVQRLTADWLATPIPPRSQLRQDPRHPA